jgi:serine protease Do
MRRSFVILLVSLPLLAGACGLLPDQSQDGGEGGAQKKGPQPANSIEEAKQATIYIEARGGLYDVGREFGELSYGIGSGFIIDPSGLAVTNNHVVTGASTLDIYVEGEDEPLGAQVLGVSECSDLAVIDIEGDGFKEFLAWREGPIESSLHVNALGYPADDVEAGEKPDQTFSEGAVNSTEADVDLAWASVESVLEHAAQIRSGNSGGPLVDDNGRVVGINFAGGGVEAQQYYAISRDEARDMVERLKQGNADSIGVNGEADQSLAGIAVASVETGSPAFDVGVRGAEVDEASGTLQIDVIKELEGTKLAENSNMNAYCEILRQRGADDEMTIQVERYTLDEDSSVSELAVLEGVVNGEPLKEVESAVADQYASGSDDAGSGDGSGGGSDPGSSEFTEIQNETGSLVVEVPTGWDDRVTGAWEQSGERLGVQVSASPDLQAYNEGWATPGMFFGASRTLVDRYPEDTVNQVLEQFRVDGDCTYDGREAYDDGVYKGSFDTWSNCGDAGSAFQTIAAMPEDGSYVVLVQTVILDDAGLAAQQKIIETFRVVGEVE